MNIDGPELEQKAKISYRLILSIISMVILFTFFGTIYYMQHNALLKDIKQLKDFQDSEPSRMESVKDEMNGRIDRKYQHLEREIDLINKVHRSSIESLEGDYDELEDRVREVEYKTEW